VFVEVVRKDGFARAAEAPDTSPANVTRYISDLESHLGTRLLNRSSRKMSLTESGDLTLFLKPEIERKSPRSNRQTSVGRYPLARTSLTKSFNTGD
jgi:hypothetical protein